MLSSVLRPSTIPLILYSDPLGRFGMWCNFGRLLSARAALIERSKRDRFAISSGTNKPLSESLLHSICTIAILLILY